jgi:hypothetical protein
MSVVRNALTGLRTGWQHLKASIPSTLASDINSHLEPAARVDRFDYAADGSEDDRKEAALASTKDNESSKVRQPISILTKLLTADMCFF